MKTVIACFSLFCAVVSSSALGQGSVSGKWHIRTQMGGGNAMTCDFLQKEEQLTGTCAAGQKNLDIVGTVNGPKVNWVIKSEYNGAPLTMKYEGTYDHRSKITGTSLIMEFLRSADFVATRDGSPDDSDQSAGGHGEPAKTPSCPPAVGTKFSARPGIPDFGPNVIIFDPKMPSIDVQCEIDKIATAQERAEFDAGRYAIFFMPGQYTVDAKAAYFTQLAGLGLSPDDVQIRGHVVSVDPSGRSSILVSFWRSAENMSVAPPDGVDYWAVSQAAPLRRMHVRGNLFLHENSTGSGGFIADSEIDGVVDATRQQQWFTRNSIFEKWKGGMWNMVFVGVSNAPPASPGDIQLPPEITFENPVITNIPIAPISREKPFLAVDKNGTFGVFVPALAHATTSVSWKTERPVGRMLPLTRFFIAKPTMTAAEINERLSAGKSIILTPGIYYLSEPIHVTKSDTIVMGLGLATIEPTEGNEGLIVDDVGGVQISGVLFNAGLKNSPALLRVGPSGAAKDHRANPTFLYDIFARVGDKGARSATSSVVINNADVVIDDSWLWRADHGPDIGWKTNVAPNGLTVNGDNVIAYGLFVEHYQAAQVVWNGDRGRTYFLQSEIPANPPWPEATKPGSQIKGYPAYMVSEKVKHHEAWGLGSYFFLSRFPSVTQEHSFEVPKTPGVVLHNAMTFTKGPWAKTEHVVNDYGSPASQPSLAAPVAFVPRYPLNP